MRVGVIGTAGVGRAHVSALQKVEDVDVVAIAGSTRESVDRAAAALHIPNAFVGGAQLIESGLVDAVHICTPNALHPADVRAAIDAAIHVVCEKPLSTDAQIAYDLSKLDRRSSTRSTVCYHYRYAPLMQQLVQIVQSGALGDIHTVRATYLQNWQIDAAATWRNDPEQAGPSRVLSDIGSHLLDLVEVATGRQITRLEARTQRRTPDRRSGDDDAAIATAQLRGGALASLVVSQISPAHMNSVTVELDGQRGSASWALGDVESLKTVRTSDIASLRLDRHESPTTAGRYWVSPVDANARLEALFQSFYGHLADGGVGRTATITLPKLEDAARHVRLIQQAVDGAMPLMDLNHSA
ncbi:Gfo/Idh/MocA family protein [Microbacterium sp. E-13]|uniref:Gfo/Idh/MocA family protein n=1 Tax=Microbacterium sp. E-13 TaxID=3404048 RepID=UPI003CF8737E